jgi:mannose-1-phosphate guanylyltransferase
MEMCALIMAGGRGTRFWPWSSDLLPKQFLSLAHPRKTLLQQTYERIVELTGPKRVLILTNKEYVALVRTQLPDLPVENIIGEPMIRDTAAAVSLGAAIAARHWPDAVQMVLPADHEIDSTQRFREVMAYASKCADSDGKLYTIGLKPSRPSPAYGYLCQGDSLESAHGFTRCLVEAFIEKPDLDTAKTFVDSGKYYWNGGIFIWKASAALEALRRQLPTHEKELPEAIQFLGAPEFGQKLHSAFLKLPKISIDFGMMQAEGSTGNVACVEGDFAWSDLGGWEAFAQHMEPDSHRNTGVGHLCDWEDGRWSERFLPRKPAKGDKDEELTLGEVFTKDSSGNFVFNNRQGHQIVLFGVNDLTVVHTHQSTLICPRSKAEQIKEIVSELPSIEKKGGIKKPIKIEKPWGWELWWGWSDDFAGKTLFIEKGRRFSLQYHVLKEEVLYLHQGKAKVLTGARGGEMEEIIIEAGLALEVEPGRVHRFEAIEDCLIFEASTPFLWDVVRVADDFGREGTRASEVSDKE